MRPACACLLAAAFSFPPAGLCEGDAPFVKREVFGTFGVGRLFRFDDKSFGNGPNLGAGVGLRLRNGLGFEFEWNRTLGLSLVPAPCGIAGLQCEINARQGVSSANVASANVFYYFSRSYRVQPYVTGGLGALWSKGKEVSILVQDSTAIAREEDWSDTGLAWNIGAGLRIEAGKGFWLRPEIRLLDATARSRANLSLFRASIGAGYDW